MGRIIGKTYNAVTEVAGVRLGQPTVVKADGTPPAEGDTLTDCYFAWDDSRIPTGEIDATGVLTVAVEEIDGTPQPAPVVAVKVGGKAKADAVRVKVAAPVRGKR
jgi:hypothetical protein